MNQCRGIAGDPHLSWPLLKSLYSFPDQAEDQGHNRPRYRHFLTFRFKSQKL